MTVLSKQIHFVASLKNKALVSVILGVFLSMIILFLEPYDTNEYESDYRTTLLLGFGVLVGGVYFAYSHIEQVWYNNIGKVWRVTHEIGSVFLFYLLSGTIIFLYNHFIINNQSYSLGHHLGYYVFIVLPMIPVLTPIMVYLRQRFGECIIPPLPNMYTITGNNKNETLDVLKQDLLYVQAEENYINICYTNADKNTELKTFRQTLTSVQTQAPFLQKCHRSYLVNIDCIYEIQGNSQQAKIAFKNTENKIPLSKTFYKAIKSKTL